ncbi:MAG TPA: HRDC domain-containing protein [Pyrinomonadaceae bacterium]|nr:HRDC domain-containing protein [Pyrinomonadaceae bacterium]
MPDVPDSSELTNPRYRLITDADAARDASLSLTQETIVGLDTETYWDVAANRSRVSLVQIAPRVGEVLVFDLFAVDVEILRPIIESPAITMTAHNARFDEGMLAGAGLRPAAFVDTLRLARTALWLPSYSLAGVSAHLFGIELDKSYQKSNWKRRPLSRAQLQYAAADAIITLRVYEELERILTEQGKFDAALSAATLQPSSGEAREPRKRRAPQPPPRPLTDEEKRVVRVLKKWRLEKSFAEHVPAYMICADRTLEHLVLDRPATLEALNNIHGLGASKISRFGAELLEELKRAFGE